MKKLLFLATIVLGILFSGFTFYSNTLKVSAHGGCDPSHKVYICHANQGVKDYAMNCVDKNSTTDGHGDHDEDIIPAYTFNADSHLEHRHCSNWDSIHNHCDSWGIWSNGAKHGNSGEKARQEERTVYSCPSGSTVKSGDITKCIKNQQGDQSILTNNCVVSTPTPTATATPTTTPTATPTATASACSTPHVTPTPTPCESASPEPSPTPTVEPTASPEATPIPTDNSGTGGTSDSGSGGNPGPAECTDTKPNTPYLRTAMALVGNSVKLTWEKVLGASTGYSVFYGPTCDNFLYSVVDTGNVDNYTINGITNGCFQVRAKNGCAIGDPSNSVTTGQVLGTSTGSVLGASTLPKTGGFEEMVMNIVFATGSILSALGIRKRSSKQLQ